MRGAFEHVIKRYVTFDRLAGEVLVPFSDFRKSFLSELRHSRHSVCVDLDSGDEVCVTPSVRRSCRTTHLNVHAATHQVSDEILVRITDRNASFGVLGLVVQ